MSKKEAKKYSVESVEEVVYLEVRFIADGRMERELNRGISMAMSSDGAMRKKVFGSRELSKKAKVEVNNAMVERMMTYGCESWVLKER